MKPITIIKLGGSCITDKSHPYTTNRAVIHDLAQQLKDITTPLVIVNGQGSFAHTSAQQYGGKKGYKNKLGIAKVAYDVTHLSSIVNGILLEEGLPVISLRPMSLLYTQKGHIKKSLFPIVEELLKQNLIPLLCGDGIVDTDWKTTIYSGETIIHYLSEYLLNHNYPIKQIIQIGITNGVYDSKKETIPIISPKNWKELKKVIYTIQVADVSGGMQHKVEESLSLAKKGIPTWIINGKNPGELKKVLKGKKVKGTQIVLE